MTPSEHDKIRDALAACRPDSDDLAAPEMAEAAAALERDPALQQEFAQGQEFDRRVQAVIHDTPVPDRLCERLLEGVAVAEDPASAQGVSPASLRENEKKMSRRWLLYTPVAILLGIAIGVAAWVMQNQGPSTFTTAQVLSKAADVLEASDTTRWESPSSVPQGYAIPSDVRGNPRGWAYADAAPIDSRAVVHNLTPRHGGGSIYLLAMATEASTPDMPESPPEMPQVNTGGWCRGAWRRGEVIYVLAVEGSHLRYRSTLGGAMPLAVVFGR